MAAASSPLIVPKGSITEAQQNVIDSARARAMRYNNKAVDIIVTEY
jgi:hypothetical protein